MVRLSDIDPISGKVPSQSPKSFEIMISTPIKCDKYTLTG